MAVYFFDRDQKLIKLVGYNKVVDVWQEQEIKDDSSLLNDVLTAYIKNDPELLEPAYFAVKEYGGNRNAFDMYEIRNITTGKHTEFIGIQLAASELDGYIIEDFRPTNRSFRFIAEKLLENTDWEVGYVDSGLNNVSTNFYYLSVKDALKRMQSLGCELKFKVEISGNGISKKWVEIYKRIGNMTNRRFVYGKTALEIEREISYSDTYTALIGRGRGEETQDEEGEATGGFGRKINFANVEWKISNSDPVNKPLGQKYVELPAATDVYGITTYSGKKPRIGLIEFSDEEDTERLLERTYEKLVNIARPQVQFKTNVAIVGDFEIGDIVTIHRYDLGIHYQTRIFKVKRNRKNNEVTELSIGDKLIESSSEKAARVSSTIKDIKDVQTEMKNNINYVAVNGKGNKVNYGNMQPETAKVGDEWFRDHPEKSGERQLLVFDGTGWKIEYDTSDVKDGSKLEYGVIDAGGDLSIINLTADSIVSGSLDLTKGIKISAGDLPVLSVDTKTGEVEMNVSKLKIKDRNIEELKDGTSFVLSKDSAIIKQKIDGSADYSNANTEFVVFTGDKNVTSDWVIDVVPSENLEGNKQIQQAVFNLANEGTEEPDGTKIKYTVTNLVGVDGYVDFIATKNSLTFRKRFTVTKVMDGENGKNGEDGESQFIHFAWSNSSDGNLDFSKTESANKLYVGIYADNEEEGSNKPIDYHWSKVKGEKGEKGNQGEKGEKGADGKQYYTWVKYADTPTSGMSDKPNGKGYIGLAYNKETPEESTNYADYDWSYIKGEQGIPGKDGVSYTWIKYADDEHGEGMSDSPDGKNYIGIAYNKTSATKSTKPEDYIWSLLNVEDELKNKVDNSDFNDLSDSVGNIGEAVANKADLGELQSLMDEYNVMIEQNYNDKRELSDKLSTLEGRTALVENIMGDKVERWEFIETVITNSEEGIFIGNNNKKTGVLLSDERISFMDNDVEVAFISNQTMEISHGIFVKSATIGKHKFETLPNSDITVVNYVG